MADVKCIAPTRIGGTEITYAQGMRAGSWLFFTGHMASDFEHGLAPAVAGKPGLPLGSPPRYRREGDFIIDRFAKLIAAEGGDLRHIVRVDQYYPDAQVVNAYQRARKAVLKEFVPPSTSVLMDELLVAGANMDVSMIAVLPGGERTPRPAQPDGVPVPQHSGFIASLVSGDYVFVAGQMPNNEEMTGIAKPAYRPPNALWNGTDIRLQTEFLITSRLKPALEAGGSSLKNAIKAQVYLTNIDDLPEFLDVWNGHFGDHPCALTVVATKGLALVEFDPGDQYLRLARQRQDQEADRRPQGIAAHAAGPRGGARRRSPVLVGALRRRRRRGHPAGARHGRLEIFRRARASRDAGDPDGGRRDLRRRRCIDLEPAPRQSLRERSQRRLSRLVRLAGDARGRAHPVRRGADTDADAGARLQRGGGHVGLSPLGSRAARLSGATSAAPTSS